MSLLLAQVDEQKLANNLAHVPSAMPLTRTHRIQTLARPTSTAAANSQPGSSPVACRRSLADVYEDVSDADSQRHGRTYRTASTIGSRAISMDDVYAVNDTHAKRQSIQLPPYAANGYSGIYAENKKEILGFEPSSIDSSSSSRCMNHSTASVSGKILGMASRTVMPTLLLVPLLVALGLASFSTSQSDTLRQVVDVVRIHLPGSDFQTFTQQPEVDPLILGSGPLVVTNTSITDARHPSSTTAVPSEAHVTTPLASQSTSSIIPSNPPPRRSSRGNAVGDTGGVLSIGLWGWSLTPNNGDPVVLSSPLQMYDQLYGLFGATAGNDSLSDRGPTIRKISEGDFSRGLGRCFLFHSIGLFLTMAATFFAGIFVFRRHVRNNAFVNPGLVQHVLLSLATTSTAAAWIIDRCYITHTADSLQGRYRVTAGICPTLTVAALGLLAASTLVSTVPIFIAFILRQQKRSRQWTDVMEVEAEPPTSFQNLTVDAAKVHNNKGRTANKWTKVFDQSKRKRRQKQDAV